MNAERLQTGREEKNDHRRAERHSTERIGEWQTIDEHRGTYPNKEERESEQIGIERTNVYNTLL